MSAVATHEKSATPKEEFFQYTNLGPTLFALLVGAGLAIAVCLLGLLVFPVKQFLFSWLFAFSFFFTITAGSLFWILLHYAVDAEWSVVVRRILETMANSFSYLWIFFIPLLIGAHKVYGWMDVPRGRRPGAGRQARAAEPEVLGGARRGVLLVFLHGVVPDALVLDAGRIMTGDPGWSTKARGLSFASIPFFGVFLTFAGIDWLMSISYHWYSTMWGVYIFAGQRLVVDGGA